MFKSLKFTESEIRTIKQALGYLVSGGYDYDGTLDELWRKFDDARKENVEVPA